MLFGVHENAGRRTVSADPLAIVGIDGHIYVHEKDGEDAVRLTWSLRDISYGVWTVGASLDRIRYYWPTWSPDGRRLACFGTFGTEIDERGTGIYVFDAVDGIESWDVWSGTSRSPLYMSWSADSRTLAFVTQQPDVLSLSLVDIDDLSSRRGLFSGFPLFHRFSPNGRFLAVCLGGRFNGEDGQRLYCIDVSAPEERLTVAESAGFFGTPSWSPSGRLLAFTIARDYDQMLCVSVKGQGPPRELVPIHPQASLSWLAGGRSILVAQGPGTPSSPFSSLSRIGIPTRGTPRASVVYSGPLFGAQALRDGRILVIAPGEEAPSARWIVVEPDGSSFALPTFFPSNAQQFIFKFFHQFQASHRLIAADESKVVCTGYRSAGEMNDDHTLPQVFTLALSPGAKPEVISEGSIACWPGPFPRG